MKLRKWNQSDVSNEPLTSVLSRVDSPSKLSVHSVTVLSSSSIITSATADKRSYHLTGKKTDITKSTYKQSDKYWFMITYLNYPLNIV